MIGNGKRPLSLKDRVDDYTLGLEDKKEKRKEKEEKKIKKAIGEILIWQEKKDKK